MATTGWLRFIVSSMYNHHARVLAAGGSVGGRTLRLERGNNTPSAPTESQFTRCLSGNVIWASRSVFKFQREALYLDQQNKPPIIWRDRSP